MERSASRMLGDQNHGLGADAIPPGSVRNNRSDHQPRAGRTPSMRRILVIIGVVIAMIGLLWPWLARLGLGRLPGDIYVQGENGSFYFPITTCILVSVVVSLLLWLFNR